VKGLKDAKEKQDGQDAVWASLTLSHFGAATFQNGGDDFLDRGDDRMRRNDKA
jgi:hypothetical protein